MTSHYREPHAGIAQHALDTLQKTAYNEHLIHIYCLEIYKYGVKVHSTTSLEQCLNSLKNFLKTMAVIKLTRLSHSIIAVAVFCLIYFDFVNESSIYYKSNYDFTVFNQLGPNSILFKPEQVLVNGVTVRLMDSGYETDQTCLSNFKIPQENTEVLISELDANSTLNFGDGLIYTSKDGLMLEWFLLIMHPVDWFLSSCVTSENGQGMFEIASLINQAKNGSLPGAGPIGFPKEFIKPPIGYFQVFNDEFGKISLEDAYKQASHNIKNDKFRFIGLFEQLRASFQKMHEIRGDLFQARPDLKWMEAPFGLIQNYKLSLPDFFIEYLENTLLELHIKLYKEVKQKYFLI